METRKSIVACVACLALCTMVGPTLASLQVSLGIRETAAGGGPEVAIGGNAGTLGGIEFVNLDGQTVPFDNQWHGYTWSLGSDPLTAFAGTTANSVLDGAYGSIEHLRFKNHTGVTAPITIWIDYVVNTVAPGPTVVESFEGAAVGTEVMFQEPSFSGSTGSNLLPGSTAAVNDSTAFDGLASYKVDWTFVDNDPTRWVRLTTFGTAMRPNPLIRFDQGSQVTVYIKALPEPATAMMMLIPALAVLRRRR